MLVGYLLMCLIFGTTFMAIKVGLNAGAPPLFFAGLRFTLAGLLALGLVLLRRIPVSAQPKALRQIALVGLTNTTITFAALFWAEQYLSSGLAATLSAGSPLFTLLFMQGGLRRLRLPQVIGIMLGLVGVLLVMQPHLGLGGGMMAVVAACVLLLGELASAWGSVRSQAVMQSGIHPLTFNAIQMLCGGPALLVASLALESGASHALQPTTWGALLYLVLVGSVIGVGLYYWLIARTGPVLPSTWTYVSPVVATGVGALMLGESVGPFTLVGLALVLGGVVLADETAFRWVTARA